MEWICHKICLVKSTVTDPEVCCAFSDLSSRFPCVENQYGEQPAAAAAAALVQTDSQESQKERVRDHKCY